MNEYNLKRFEDTYIHSSGMVHLQADVRPIQGPSSVSILLNDPDSDTVLVCYLIDHSHFTTIKWEGYLRKGDQVRLIERAIVRPPRAPWTVVDEYFETAPHHRYVVRGPSEELYTYDRAEAYEIAAVPELVEFIESLENIPTELDERIWVDELEIRARKLLGKVRGDEGG